MKTTKQHTQKQAYNILFDQEQNIILQKTEEDKTPTFVNMPIKQNTNQFVCLNPYKSTQGKRMHGTGRQEGNIDKIQCLCIEQDSTSLDLQKEWLNKILGKMFSVKVFSGNKSIHCFIRFTEEITKEQYNEICENIKILFPFCDFGVLKNINGLVRNPGGTRKGKKQTILEIGQRVNFETLNKRLKNLKAFKTLPDEINEIKECIKQVFEIGDLTDCFIVRSIKYLRESGYKIEGLIKKAFQQHEIIGDERLKGFIEKSKIRVSERKQLEKVKTGNMENYTYSQDYEIFLQNIKSIPIKDIINILSLKGGKGNKYMCPGGHDKKTPSFSIEQRNNYFQCFGCKKSGDTIELVRFAENLTFRQALNFLSDTFNIIEPRRKFRRIQTEENLISVHNKVKENSDSLMDILERELKENNFRYFNIEAIQSAGKSYTTSHEAVNHLKNGGCTIFFTRSHDEIEQWTETTKKILEEEKIDIDKIFHMQSGYDSQTGLFRNEIPEERPIIICAPHAYLKTKGDSLYHFKLLDMIKNNEFGENCLIFIDEASSYIDGCFVSKQLATRLTERFINDYKIYIPNNSCPLSNSSGNCLNCQKMVKMLPTRNSAGLLEYKTIGQHRKEDRHDFERFSFTGDVIDDQLTLNDKTMNIYPIFIDDKKREWSMGGKNDKTLVTSLDSHIKDLMKRLITCHVVEHFPYDKKTEEPIKRPLNQNELNQKKKGKLEVAIPRQLCNVRSLQGWDSIGILGLLQSESKVVFVGPEMSTAQRQFLDILFGKNIKHLSIKNPFNKMKKIKIITTDIDLNKTNKENIELLKDLSDTNKTLFFSSTMEKAKRFSYKVGKKILSIFYDGAEHIRHTRPGEDMKYNLYISYNHGPIGQGIDLPRYKNVAVDCNCDKPKFCFGAYFSIEDTKRQSFQDIVNTCMQCIGRILRKEKGLDNDEERIILLYGKNSYYVGEAVRQKLIDNQHFVTELIHAEKQVETIRSEVFKFWKGEQTQNPENIKKVIQVASDWKTIENLPEFKQLSKEEKLKLYNLHKNGKVNKKIEKKDKYSKGVKIGKYEME